MKNPSGSKKQNQIIKASKHYTAQGHVRSTQDDETYLNLIQEVDAERERRWKAEQATRKLLDNLKSMKEACKL